MLSMKIFKVEILYGSMVVKIRYICILLFLPFTFLFSHHTTMGAGSGNLTGRVNLPGTGVINQEPSPYLLLNSEYFKGSRGNQDILESSIFGEAFFAKGRLSLNLSFSHFYFVQKDKEDASRMGRGGVGGKVFLLPLQTGWLFFWENRINFPSGNAPDRYTGGNYYTLEESLVFGKVIQSLFPIIRIGGVFPDRTIYKFQKYTTERNLPYPLRQFAETETEELFLKKSTFVQLSINYFLSEQLSIYAGYNWRTPYNGVETPRDDVPHRMEKQAVASLQRREVITDAVLQNYILSEVREEKRRYFDSLYYSEPAGAFRKEPLLFREVFLGFLYSHGDHFSYNFTLKYPLQREKYFRIYDTSTSISIIARF